jgi:hypothetical protein
MPTTSRPGRGPTLLGRLVALVLLALVAGIVVPGAAASAVGRIVAGAVEAQVGGQVRAEVRALPFWQLGRGRFQHLTVVGEDLQSGALTIASLRADWSDGRVDMAALEHGAPIAAWAKGGRLVVQLTIGARALDAIVPHRGALAILGVRLAGPDAIVHGRLRFDGIDLPFRAVGRPAVVDDGSVLLFRVTVVSAGPLALRDALGLPVVDLRRTPLWGALWIVGARIARNRVVVTLANRPTRAQPGRRRLP